MQEIIVTSANLTGVLTKLHARAFAERLRYWAETRFPTLGECANAIGVEASNLTKYMNGSRRPNMDVLERIAALGVSLDWLVNGEGEIETARGAESLPLADQLQIIVEKVRAIERPSQQERKDQTLPPEFQPADPTALDRPIIKLDDADDVPEAAGGERSVHNQE